MIAPDHLERATSFERMQVHGSPVVINTLSALRLDRLAGEQGFDFALLVDAWSQMPARSWRSAGRMRV